MASPLLTTKLYVPPIRSEMVPRPRLEERMDAGMACKLTLVSGPAGYGKTMLLSEWIHSAAQKGTPLPAAWLSLDQDDNDPVRFWQYAVAALQTVDAAIGEGAQAALQSPQPPPLKPLVTDLINDVAAAGTPLVLILDDYHVIEAEQIHDSLNFLLDHLPSQMHLVISTRADPPLPLPRLRARGQLNELRTADLLFTPEEAAAFLNEAMGLMLSEEDVTALVTRVEGWIAGLQLAALSLQGRVDKHGFVLSFAGDDRYVVDYLAEEVLHKQPPHVRAFLLQTSILERLCGPLCDAVTGRDNSQEVLDSLDQANLFIIPLDNRRLWYRYHHLFADLLRRHAARSEGPQDLASRYLRASEWFEEEGSIAEAVSYALAGSDFEHAADLVGRHAMDMFYRSETLLTHSWLEALPEDVVRARPMLCVAYAFSTMLAPPLESPELAEPWLQEAEKRLAGAGDDLAKDLDEAERDRIAGYAALARAYQARFRRDAPQTVLDLSLEARERLPESDLRSRGALANNLALTYLALGDEETAGRFLLEARQSAVACGDFLNALAAVFIQTEIARKHARLHEAAAICREGLRSVDMSAGQVKRPAPYAGHVYTALGRILTEWNDLKGAVRALTKGLELSALTGDLYFRELGHVALARARQAQGDWEGALAVLEQMKQLSPVLTTARHAATFQARLLLLQAEDDPRHLAAAARWAKEGHIKLGDIEAIRSNPLAFEPLCNEQLALARLLTAQRRARPSAHSRKPSDMQPLLLFLDRQLHLAEGGGWTDLAIHLLIAQVMALQAEGHADRAVASLHHALALAEPGGYVRVFIDEGPRMAALLMGILKTESRRKDRQATAHGFTRDYVARLLAAFPPRQRDRAIRPGARAAPTQAVPPPIEPLSPRELEVLQLVAAGASNAEIAQELFISINTVKRHVTHIFRKLAATSRTQVVARARGLGLVE